VSAAPSPSALTPAQAMHATVELIGRLICDRRGHNLARRPTTNPLHGSVGHPGAWWSQSRAPSREALNLTL
jgi:hypothetical protein